MANSEVKTLNPKKHQTVVKSLRIIKFLTVAISLFVFALALRDVYLTYTVGESINQGEIGFNTFIIEGIDFRTFVTEISLGAFASAFSLLADYLERYFNK